MKHKQIDYQEKIVESALNEVMHNSYMTYAEYVTMERALPRVEDGLKPVQRRILYTLSELGITPDKPYKKSARIVGEALGKYHPHGDTSVYDAMVRLAQDYTMRAPLVDGHGNFGSMDGDSPAAMRYTEARMSALALEMLRDLDKDTVAFRPNFDDTEREPDMLPARFPNLLVNGASGIAVGLATNIPPHNLAEVIDGVVMRMEHPHCELQEMMDIVKGPDFPTGGYLLCGGELEQAYRTGKGRVQIRAKTHFEKQPNGKTSIVITEVPYEVKKANLLEKVLQVSEQKKDLFAGIDDIRDESDREGVRAVIEIKKGHDAEKILNLLYKYTDMQVTFGINMMVIADGAPQQLGLLPVMDYYIRHQKNVVTRRTRYDLEKAEKREHILQGLMIAVQNIDRVIKLIRASKNTEEARKALMAEFNLTSIQAQAILDMRLARLTNLEIITLENEYKEVVALIKYLKSILDSEEKLLEVIKDELLLVKENYADKRRTQFISAEKAQIVVDESEFIATEDCIITLTRGGNLKRMTLKAWQKGAEAEDLEEKLQPSLITQTDTGSKIFLFTNKGNLYTIASTAIPEARMREAGKSLNALIPGVENDEVVLNILVKQDFACEHILFASRSGLVKAVAVAEFDVKKTKIMACGLKDGDELIYVQPDDPNAQTLLCLSSDGMSIRFAKSEISVMGRSGKGVGAMKLGVRAKLVLAAQIQDGQEGNVLLMTEKGYAKQTPLAEFDVQGRNGKGLKAFQFTPHNGKQIVGALIVERITKITTLQNSGEMKKIMTDTIPTDERNTKGEQVVLAVLGNDVERVYMNILE